MRSCAIPLTSPEVVLLFFLPVPEWHPFGSFVFSLYFPWILSSVLCLVAFQTLLYRHHIINSTYSKDSPFLCRFRFLVVYFVKRIYYFPILSRDLVVNLHAGLMQEDYTFWDHLIQHVIGYQCLSVWYPTVFWGISCLPCYSLYHLPWLGPWSRVLTYLSTSPSSIPLLPFLTPCSFCKSTDFHMSLCLWNIQNDLKSIVTNLTDIPLSPRFGKY